MEKEVMRMRPVVFVALALVLTFCACRGQPTRTDEAKEPAAKKPAPVLPPHEPSPGEVALLVGRIGTDEVVGRDEFGVLTSPAVDAVVACGEDAVGALMERWHLLYQQKTGFAIRYQVLGALRRIASPKACLFLGLVLLVGDDKERRIAARSAMEWGDGRLIPALVRQMEHPNREVLCEAAAALRRITGIHFGVVRKLPDDELRKAAAAWVRWYNMVYIPSVKR